MRTVPDAFAAPIVVTREVAKFVTAPADPDELEEDDPLELALELPPDVLDGDVPVPLDPFVEPDVLLTDEATDAGSPEAAAAFDTGPLLVAIMSGAYADAPNS